MRRSNRPATRALRRFFVEDDGNLTMEFMLWMPVFLFILMFGLAGYDAFNRRYAALAATETLTDILSRQYLIDAGTLDDLERLQAALLPGTGDPQTLRLSAIRCTKPLDADGDPIEADPCVHEAVWSCGVGSGADANTPLTPDAPLLVLPVDLPPLRHLEEVLMVELSVPFTAISESAGLDVDGWYVPLLVKPRYVSRLRIEAGLTDCTASAGAV